MSGIIRVRGGRRRFVLLGALLAVALVGGAAAGDLLSPSDPRLESKFSTAVSYNTDIDSYVLFALDELAVKGGDASKPSKIRGGNVGVNAAGEISGKARLKMCNGSGDGNPIQMDEGSLVAADSIDIQRACTLWDVRSGVYTHQSSPRAFRMAIGQPWYPIGTLNPPPMITNLPPKPSIPCATGTKATWTTGSPAPGTYGDVTIDGTVTLQPGVYKFCSLKFNGLSALYMTNTTEVQVQGVFSMPKGIFGSPSSINAKLTVSGTQVSFGKGSTVYAQMWAWNAEVGLGNNTNLFGKFWFRSGHSDFGMEVNDCPHRTCAPGGSTTTSSSSSTTSTTRPSVSSSSSTTSTTRPTTASSTTSTTRPSTTSSTVKPTSTTSTTRPASTTTSTLKPTTTTVPEPSTTETTLPDP